MADANGLPFVLLADGADLLPGSGDGAGGATWHGERRLWHLRSRRQLEQGAGDLEATALEALEQVPQAVDAFGATAFYDPEAGEVRVRTADLPGETTLLSLEPGESVQDLLVGSDGLLYVAEAAAGALRLQDLKRRHLEELFEVPGLAPRRLAADPRGGVWALDPDAESLVLIRASRLRSPDVVEEDPAETDVEERFRPEEPASIEVKVRLQLTLEAGERAVALACDPTGRPIVLLWDEFGRASLLWPLGASAFEGTSAVPSAARRVRLELAPEQSLLFPFALDVDRSRIALLAPELDEAAVFADLPESAGAVWWPVGERYPLVGHDGGPFAHRLEGPPRLSLQPAEAGIEGTAFGETRDLAPLSLPSMARRGSLESPALDAAKDGAVWHRLYVEASIPQGCGLIVEIQASEKPFDPGDDGGEWHRHVFGSLAASQPVAEGGIAPRGVWLQASSELPFHPGLLGCEPEPDRAGLFTVLVQRSGRRVSALRGRYARLRLTLLGDGRATPEVAAIRLYAGRFSYVEQYLPELYHEQEVGPEADEIGAATGSDFLERLLSITEGVLTPLEDRIAHADLLTDPSSTPAESLPWLASWLGVSFEEGLPDERRRRRLRLAPELDRRRGTFGGLLLILDVMTGGAVARGQVVAVEDFRMRRTVATVLGAYLEEEDDPVTLGLSSSSQSLVGDSLILGEASRREVLALFAPDQERGRRDQAAVDAFFDRFAHRLSVLVDPDLEEKEQARVRGVLEREMPAHVSWRVSPASRGLRVAVASLVGIDTYLAAPPSRPRTTIAAFDRPALRGHDAGRLGATFLDRPPSLDARLGGSGSPD